MSKTVELTKENVIETINEAIESDFMRQVFVYASSDISKHEFVEWVSVAEPDINPDSDPEVSLGLQALKMAIDYDDVWDAVQYEFYGWLQKLRTVNGALLNTPSLHHVHVMKALIEEIHAELSTYTDEEKEPNKEFFMRVTQILNSPQVFSKVRKRHLDYLGQMQFIVDAFANMKEITADEFNHGFEIGVKKRTTEDIDYRNAIQSDSEWIRKCVTQVVHPNNFSYYAEQFLEFEQQGMAAYLDYCQRLKEMLLSFIKRQLFFSQYIVKKSFSRTSEGWDEFIDYVDVINPTEFEQMYMATDSSIREMSTIILSNMISFINSDVIQSLENKAPEHLRKPLIATSLIDSSKLISARIESIKSDKSIAMNLYATMYANVEESLISDIQRLVNKVQDHFGTNFWSNTWKSFKRGGVGRAIGGALFGNVGGVVGGILASELQEEEIRQEVYRDFEAITSKLTRYIHSLSKFESTLYSNYENLIDTTISELIMPYANQCFVKYQPVRVAGITSLEEFIIKQIGEYKKEFDRMDEVLSLANFYPYIEK